jgi:uncharacterized RDD family membrane protein YckC
MKYGTIFRRLVAYFIDILVVFLLVVSLLQLAVFVPLRHFVIGSEDWFHSGWHTEVYTWLTISLPVWLYFILFEKSGRKATPGKLLMKLQTMDLRTGSWIGFLQSLLRTFIKLLPWELAHFTNNIPVPMWSDPHPSFRVGFVIVPLLVLAYIAVARFTPRKQAPHDLAARTLVVLSG